MPPHLPSRSTVADNGMRFVGTATRLYRESVPVATLAPGRPEDALYGAQFTLRPRGSAAGVTGTVLSLLRDHIQATGVELPPLHKGSPLTLPADRYGGLEWRESLDVGAWSGELLWRTRHPTVRGTAITHQIVLEERRYFDRFSLRITADDGLAAIRAPVGAGQARPAFLDELARHFEVTAWGGLAGPRTLTALDVEEFVRSTLLARQRQYPVALMAPLEEGGYPLDPDDLSREFLGVAPLYILDEHPTTFRLTDTLRDKRMSCFFGALRFYMPGFTAADDPRDHPLLIRDRVLDPVMRAADLGRAAIHVGRHLDVPEVPGRTPPPAEPVPEADVAGEASPGTGEGPGTGTGTAEDESQGLAAAMDEVGVLETLVVEAPEPAAGADAAPAPDAKPAPAPAPEAPPPPAPVVVHFPDEWTELLRQTLAAHDRMIQQLGELTDEVERLRTLTAVRSAGTGALERRIERLQDELRERLPERAPAVGAKPDDGGDQAPDDGDAEREAAEREAADDLLGIVRSAGQRYSDELLILPEAEASAKDSPYEDPERVGALLDAMALVARRRMDGGLGVPLKEAFREFGVDYRGGVSESTSARRRSQYHFRGPDGEDYDCVEHIALGNARDARYCLRIYFTSRAKAENRFVIGHVGRHFEVAMTD